ncbi:hypothetical protein [Mycolicibacterium llatzerense]|uniref:hypothetical protein n=1 Tax=Mycolicibacterium llatzerense TaxID=280871 RepID=UPI0021B56834|nr:hypothetical protein [Mycolicibacterium llatzerense]MCT7371936.1 hypothetical protein [Mycolicibacterium llatzerense]
MSDNTILRIGTQRGRRMTEDEANTILRDMRFEPSASTPTGRTVHKARSAETLTRYWERQPGSDHDAPYRAITRSTYAI